MIGMVIKGLLESGVIGNTPDFDSGIAGSNPASPSILICRSSSVGRAVD